MHHERLDGSGYHRGCRANDVAAEARLVAAADAFAAMVRSRPHRDALPPEAAAKALTADARAGRLDREATTAVLAEAGQSHRRRTADMRPAGLTRREVEVLGLMAQGCTNAAIAERLFISRRTAEHHVQHVYTKIGASTRAAAALFAVQHDLLPK
jgi:DNA-binding NarL/FixJ family response regulator